MTTPSMKLLSAAAGGGAAAAAATVAYVGAASTNSDATSYTFSGVSLGTVDDDRTVVVCVAGRKAGTTTSISSVTVGGNVATEIVQASTTIANTNVAGIYAIDLTSGTSADIVVTFGASTLRACITVHRCTGISTTPNDTATSTASNVAASVDVSSGGALIGVVTAGISSGTPTYTWSGIVEDFDGRIGTEAAVYSVASGEFASASTVAVSATSSGGDVEPVATYAAW